MISPKDLAVDNCRAQLFKLTNKIDSRIINNRRSFHVEYVRLPMVRRLARHYKRAGWKVKLLSWGSEVKISKPEEFAHTTHMVLSE
jgi:hypothetical protein